MESRGSFPSEGWYKANFDGVAKGNLGLAGCGGVIRNHYGRSIAAVALPLGSQTNDIVEAMVAL